GTRPGRFRLARRPPPRDRHRDGGHPATPTPHGPPAPVHRPRHRPQPRPPTRRLAVAVGQAVRPPRPARRHPHRPPTQAAVRMGPPTAVVVHALPRPATPPTPTTGRGGRVRAGG